MEMMAYRSYLEKDFGITFWRRKSGLEVDFILGEGEVALEVKGSSPPDNRDLRPIIRFTNEFSPRKSIVVCNETAPRILGKIRILPYRIFLSELWAGNII